MEKAIVDFSKLSVDVLDEYGIEAFDSYKDVFYSLYFDVEEFSPYSLIDVLGDKSIPEFISNEPYLYECNDKIYRWPDGAERMYELAEKFPDAVVGGLSNNKEDDKGMTAKGALKILSYNNAKFSLDLCGYGQVISDEQLEEFQNVIIEALQSQADKQDNENTLSYAEQAALFVKENSGVAWEIHKLVEHDNHREDVIGKLKEHGITGVSDSDIDKLVESFERALSKNDGYYESFWASADYVIDEYEANMVQENTESLKDIPPTLDELVGEYERFVELTKDIRTVEQAREFEKQYHIPVEINGVSIDEYVTNGGHYNEGKTNENIEWIRYECFGHLWYLYDRFDGEPTFDIYYGEYDDDLFAEEVNISKLKSGFSTLVEDEIMRIIQQDKFINVGDNFGYTMPGGKHHIFISVVEEPSALLYFIEPNRVVDGACEPMEFSTSADFNNLDGLREGVRWCFEQFEEDKEVSLDAVLGDAVGRSGGNEPGVAGKDDIVKD